MLSFISVLLIASMVFISVGYYSDAEAFTQDGEGSIAQEEESHNSDTPYVDDEILVVFNKPLSIEAAEDITDGQVESISCESDNNADETIASGEPVLVNIGDTSESVQECINSISESGNVAIAQPNYLYSLSDCDDLDDIPDPEISCPDSRYDPWHDPENLISFNTKSTSWGFKYLNVSQAWKLIEKMRLAGTDRVNVAVIDTGLNMYHPDMQRNVDKTKCVKPVDGDYKYYYPVYNHGSKVASIIAADSNNSIGIDGIASGNHNNIVKMFGINVFSDSGRVGQYSASTSDIIAGLDAAMAFNASVVNMSMAYSPGQKDYHGAAHVDQILESKLNELADNNISVVCSAGNNVKTAAVYPSDFDSTIAVIAANRYTNAWSNVRRSTSNYGSKKALCAPGVCVPSCMINGYGESGHTSCAAPHVTSVAALILYVDPTLSPQEVKNILCSTATDVYKNGRDWQTGYGMVNAYNAVRETAVRAARKGSLRRADGSVISAAELQKMIKDTQPASMKNRSLPGPKVRASIKKNRKNRKRRDITIKWRYKSPYTLNSIKIYRATSRKGPYKCVKTFRSRTNKWTDKRLKLKQTYYYKVRIFGTTDDGKKICSEFSKEVHKKARR